MDKTKHGLRKYHFWLVKVRVYGGRREEKRRKEEKKRRREEEEEKKIREEEEIKVWNFVWNLLGFVWILVWRFRIPIFV